MTHMRTALVTVSVLAWTATASADCAWVLWHAFDKAPRGTPTNPIPRDWIWQTTGVYPTRRDCYRAMRANPVVGSLKEADLEFGSDVRPFGSDTSLLWNGNGVILDGPLSQWWSCQPENRKPQRGSYPFE